MSSLKLNHYFPQSLVRIKLFPVLFPSVLNINFPTPSFVNHETNRHCMNHLVLGLTWSYLQLLASLYLTHSVLDRESCQKDWFFFIFRKNEIIKKRIKSFVLLDYLAPLKWTFVIVYLSDTQIFFSLSSCYVFVYVSFCSTYFFFQFLFCFNE